MRERERASERTNDEKVTLAKEGEAVQGARGRERERERRLLNFYGSLSLTWALGWVESHTHCGRHGTDRVAEVRQDIPHPQTVTHDLGSGTESN